MCVLFTAAYRCNYTGVENILKNTSILAQTNNQPYYYMGNKNKPYRVHLWGIAALPRHLELKSLLRQYKVKQIYPFESEVVSTRELMGCLAGESDEVGAAVSRTELDRMLKVCVDFDRAKCFKVILANENHDIKPLLTQGLIIRAIQSASFNMLRELLILQPFDLNQATVHCANLDVYVKIEPGDELPENAYTFLDTIMSVMEENNNRSDCNKVIEILREHGAKTAAEIRSPEKNTGILASVLEAVNNYEPLCLVQ